jgi:hypothetical protein
MIKRAAAYLGLLAAYVTAAVVHARVVNVDVGRHDQSAYLAVARELARTHFEAPTNRMQMPLYPMLQALFLVDPGAPDDVVFPRAKLVNVALSVILVAILHLFFRRALPRLEALVATLATAFTVFVFRAGYVQTELLFYTLSFFLFVALGRLWERPSFAFAGLAGALAGLSFLAKGSVTPGLALFAAMFVARSAWLERSARAVAVRVAQLAAVAGAFVATTWPYLATSKRLYGEWLFNLSTRYAAWCDSWDQFMDLQARLGPWWTWGRYPERDLPSMGNYLRSHSLASMAEREVLGLGEVLGNAMIGHGYFEVIVLYLAFAWLSLRAGRGVRSIDPRSLPAFAIPYALLYLALFGFYAPIAAGPRFVLMIFLPVLYTALRAGAARAPSVVAFGRTIAWRDFNAFVLAVLVLHVAFVLPATIGRIYAGG